MTKNELLEVARTSIGLYKDLYKTLRILKQPMTDKQEVSFMAPFNEKINVCRAIVELISQIRDEDVELLSAGADETPFLTLDKIRLEDSGISDAEKVYADKTTEILKGPINGCESCQ